jgi:hypothetical protein
MYKSKTILATKETSAFRGAGIRYAVDSAKAEPGRIREADTAERATKAVDPLFLGFGLLALLAALAFIIPPIGLVLGLCAFAGIFRGTIGGWVKD